MRTVRSGVVALLCLLAVTTAHAQLPPQTPTPPTAPVTPPSTPAPTTPQTPPVIPAPGGTMTPPPVVAPGGTQPAPSIVVPGVTTPGVTTPPPATTTGAAPPPTISGPGARAPLERILGKALTQEEAVAIALETQPSIQARLSDYLAAAFRVDQAFAPLLPQLTGSWSSQRDQSSFAGTTSTGTTVSSPVRTWTTSTTARVSLSQIIFDFGKTFASTDAARRLAEQAQEDVELQRQLVTQTVKESFTNINFAQRLIRVQEQAVERANLNLRSARG